MLSVIGIIVVFLVSVVLMMRKKMPAIIAMPLMAILFALIAGVPVMSSDPETATIFGNVLKGGSTKMAEAMAGVMFGAWFSKIVTRLGISKAIVQKAAELGGDNTLVSAIVFYIAASIIFIPNMSLGSVMLVGNIIIPIMITMGISTVNAGIITILACVSGASLNVSGWPQIVQTLGVTEAQIREYLWIGIVPLYIVCLAAIVFFIKRDNGKRRAAWAMPSEETSSRTQKVPALAYLAPVIPLIMVFALKIDIIPAIMISAVITLLLARPKNPIHILSSAMVEGIQEVAGALGLFIGIGMLLVAVQTPQVSSVLTPLIEAIIPSTVVGYILFFTISVPFVLYRGPMNIAGLGLGVFALLVASGMNPLGAFLGYRVLNFVQIMCDPTNSFTVWIADFTKNDTIVYLKKILPWAIAVVVISLTIGMPIVL